MRFRARNDLALFIRSVRAVLDHEWLSDRSVS